MPVLSAASATRTAGNLEGGGGSKSAKEIFAENPVRRLTQNAAQH